MAPTDQTTIINNDPTSKESEQRQQQKQQREIKNEKYFAETEFDDVEVFDDDDERMVSLPIPEVIEMLKNLAACNEKQYKWEQSTLKLNSIPENDANKQQLMEIIDFVNNKTSTKEKAIYLYQQLGKKCRQHGNYIGAAKAFERAAGLLLDMTDQCQVSRMDDQTMLSTIRCLESAIHNYDAIHKYKHAGTLHYRCSRILRLMNANHELVQQHHIKALEYFTKPDHELKQRKRVDGFKISCYSSCSQWAQTMTRTKTKSKNKLMTTTHKTITTNHHHHHLIKFHHRSSGSAKGVNDANDAVSDLDDYEDSEDEHKSKTSNYSRPNSKLSFDFNNEVNNTFGQLEEIDYLDKYFNDPPSNVLDMRDTDGGLKTPTIAFNNESMPTTPTTPSSLGSSSITDLHNHPIKSSDITNYLPVTDNSSTAVTISSVSSNRYNKEQQQQQLQTSSYLRESRHQHHRSHQHHHQEQRYHRQSSSYLHHHHHYHQNSKQKTFGSSSSMNNRMVDQQQQKPIYRCIEDRIESAKKLVKKLHKLCPFYEVSTKGVDAGRVYCRICDRYLGAVSSTLKNHVNTQEHRQAFEDGNQQQQSSSGSLQQQQQQTIFANQPTTATIAIQALPSTNPVPMITYPIISTNVPTKNSQTNIQSSDLSVQQQINYLSSSPTTPTTSLQQPPPPPLPPPPLQQQQQPNPRPTKNFQLANFEINNNSNENETSPSTSTINPQLEWPPPSQCDNTTGAEFQPQNLYPTRSVLINQSNLHQNPHLQNTSCSPSSMLLTNSLLDHSYLPHHPHNLNHLQQQQPQLQSQQQQFGSNNSATTINNNSRPVLAYH